MGKIEVIVISCLCGIFNFLLQAKDVHDSVTTIRWPSKNI